MRVRLAVCALAAGCGGSAGAPPGALSGPARVATAGRGETCDHDAIVRDIDAARLRGHLARLGTMRFERGGHTLAGGGGDADEAVPILAEDGDLLRVAIRGQGVQLLVWIDRADLSPVTLVEHRVSRTPGADPPAEGLGLTVFPGHPVEREIRGGWVRVRGHGLFAFDGWIPDDSGELWEPDPPETPATELWIEGGSSLVDDPDGQGRVLARVTRSSRAHLLESNALGADKVELVSDDARLVGYAVRPPPMRRLGPAELADFHIDEATGPARHGCLYSEPGGAVVGVVDGPLVDVGPAAEPGWALTPIATPWGEVVLALR